MTVDNKGAGLGTKAVWSGETEIFPYGAAVVPIVSSATFEHGDFDSWAAVATERADGYIYSRNSNPTLKVLEDKVADLDGADASVAFSTGMAAISASLFALLSPGDRVVSVKDTYGGTNVLFNEFLPRFGIDVHLCPTSDYDAIEAEIAKGCKVVYLETPTNPTLKVLDLKRLSDAAKSVGATVLADNTVATPINQRPLDLGVDLVLYSATKFLAGHSDVLAGLVSGSESLIKKIYHYREIIGSTLHADAAYNVIRGLKTLELRIQRHNESAMTIAEFLNEHPKVETVLYPGLPDHEHHDVAAKQMSGFGGLLSFAPVGGFENLKTVLAGLSLVQRAAHLGGVNTVVGPPQVTSHVELTAEERARAGIPENLLRYSVGIENAEDLIEDLDRALTQIS